MRLRKAAMLACAIVLFMGSGLARAGGGWPRTVTDLAGRQVVLPAEPRRIFLQNGNHAMTLSLLDREYPLQRVVAWTGSLMGSDPSLWRLILRRWPRAADVPLLHFDAAASADIEQLLALRPDLLLLDLTKQPLVEGGPLARVAAALNIPILYADTSRDPVRNVPRTVELLGQALGREARAAQYVAYYGARLHALARPADAPRPLVFIEARAGRLGRDQCCYTQGRTSWGQLIEAAGGANLGSRLLRGSTGDIPVETLMRIRPDVYLMTGTQRPRRGAHTIPFGYGVQRGDAMRVLEDLMARPALAWSARSPQACVQGLYHQFYDSVFNIVGLEYLARALFPQRHAGLDPGETYRHILRTYTELPDEPFVFRVGRTWSGGEC